MTRHRVDVFALVAGALFTALAVGFLLDGLDAWDVDTGWVPPLVLIVLGVAGVLSTVTRWPRADASTGDDEAVLEAEAPDERQVP
jgi:hypothetical protein